MDAQSDDGDAPEPEGCTRSYRAPRDFAAGDADALLQEVA